MQTDTHTHRQSTDRRSAEEGKNRERCASLISAPPPPWLARVGGRAAMFLLPSSLGGTWDRGGRIRLLRSDVCFHLPPFSSLPKRAGRPPASPRFAAAAFSLLLPRDGIPFHAGPACHASVHTFAPQPPMEKGKKEAAAAAAAVHQKTSEKKAGKKAGWLGQGARLERGRKKRSLEAAWK